MSRFAVLDDASWARIEPLMPSSDGRRGRPFRDHREVIEGIIYRLRTGIAWRDLPASFGPWQTVCGAWRELVLVVQGLGTAVLGRWYRLLVAGLEPVPAFGVTPSSSRPFARGRAGACACRSGRG